jgi:uncharacterized protein (TIGR02217 family)
MTISSFVETIIEVGKLYGTVGGPSFNTTVVETGAGREKRNSNHSNNLGRWDLGSRNLITKDIEYLHRFFRSRRGKAQGFRFKDWLNYKATDQDSYHTGAPTFQMYKDFAEGGETDLMYIQKPRSATFSMKRGGSSFTDFTLDDTTGIVTLDADSTATITGITKANPAEITTSGSHGYSNGDEIYLASIAGMTELNGLVVTVTSTGATTFTIGIDTTAYTAYSSGGTANKYVQTNETLTFTTEFDIPVRFDTDQFPAEFLLHRDDVDKVIYRLESLPIGS